MGRSRDLADGTLSELNVDSNTLAVDATNNRVGIGTASPADALHVSKDSSSLIGIRVQNTNASGQAAVSYYNNSGTQKADVWWNNSDSSLYLRTLSTDPIKFSTNNAERMRVTDNGLTFNGDTAAANALDDYEEGNWTATMDGSTSGPSSLTQVTGTYIKIGRLCYVECYFANVNTTGASGGVRITGLPFSPSPGSQMTGNWGHVNVATWGGTNLANISPFITATYIAFYSAESGGAWAEIMHSAGTGRYLNFAGIYRTT